MTEYSEFTGRHAENLNWERDCHHGRKVLFLKKKKIYRCLRSEIWLNIPRPCLISSLCPTLDHVHILRLCLLSFNLFYSSFLPSASSLIFVEHSFSTLLSYIFLFCFTSFFLRDFLLPFFLHNPNQNPISLLFSIADCSCGKRIFFPVRNGVKMVLFISAHLRKRYQARLFI